MDKLHTTEVDAYIFIKQDLKEKGWDIRNPSRHPDGQVYTQNEIFSHLELKKQLGNLKPENVVKIKENIFWVIESKRNHSQLQQALDESIDYAKKINQSNLIKALIVSGVAGNQSDTYLVKTMFFDGKKFVPITMNGKEISGLLLKDVTERIIRENKPNLEDVPIDKKLFLSKAEKINEILHLGAINKNYRARVMAALLLSIVAKSPVDRDSDPKTLIRDINTRVEDVLEEQDKKDFADFIKISLPPTRDNHKKFRNALIQTLQELDSLDIRSAMNSGTDVLGEFYEVFLKYGNGAKEIGIVLTPRHITKFSAEVVNINPQDIVLDPACGTGGFLVAALDYVRKNYEKQIDRFKNNNIFGIDQDTDVVALAIVNMIFRGDGKTHIIEGNCFQKYLNAISKKGISTAEYVPEDSKDRITPITKVLMNPPFALKTSDEKEYRFIDHALKQMQDGGILFSILPTSVMIEDGEPLIWRKELLKNNTLIAVVKFPDELFYPIGVNTLGVFIKRGIRHKENQNILWIRALNDGHLKSKGKRLYDPKIKNDLEIIKGILQSFIVNQSINIKNIPEFQKTCPIDFSDELLELVPEVYLDSKIPNTDEIEDWIDKQLREVVSFMIRFKKDGKNET